jgi:nitroreductase/NAD-dependent dihydropyrimidine dehydrogenase PreA subunit
MITTDHTKCKKCNLCRDHCPTLSYNNDMTGNYADCIDCQQCEAVCPHGAISSSGMDPMPMEYSKIDADEFQRLIAQRRSHRDFSSQNVSGEQVQAFISHLRFSPTASNNQNLSFTVITNKDEIAKLNETVIQTITARFKNTINPLTKPLLTLMLGKRAQSLVNAKAKFLKKADAKPDMITYNAPVVILVHAPQSLMGMPVLNAGIWTGMALLYAETLGLSTCVNGYIVNALTHNSAFKSHLAIPDDHQVFSCLLLGYGKKRFTYKVNRKEPPINWLT